MAKKKTSAKPWRNFSRRELEAYVSKRRKSGKRDSAAEYKLRILRGVERGRTVSQSRGHVKVKTKSRGSKYAPNKPLVSTIAYTSQYAQSSTARRWIIEQLNGEALEAGIAKMLRYAEEAYKSKGGAQLLFRMIYRNANYASDPDNDDDYSTSGYAIYSGKTREARQSFFMRVFERTANDAVDKKISAVLFSYSGRDV